MKKSAEALKASLPKAVKFTHVGTGSAEVKEVASNRRVLGAGRQGEVHAHQRDEEQGGPRRAGRADRPEAAHAQLLGRREAARGAALLRLPPDELLRRRPRERRLLRPRPAEVPGRDEASSRSTSTAAAATSPRASTTTARRRTGPSSATASTPAWPPRGRTRRRTAVEGLGVAVRAGEAAAAQGSSRSARRRARRRSKTRRRPPRSGTTPRTNSPGSSASTRRSR